MTLQNGLVHGRKSYLWADTAYWNAETGEFGCYDTKAFRGQRWPFAGILANWGGNPMEIAEDISKADPEDLDALLAATVDGLFAYAARGGGGRVLIASYTDRPRLHIVACHELFPGSGYGPFEPVELDHFTCSALETAAYRTARAKGFTPKRMRDVIDAQIQSPFSGEGPLAALGPRVWIGGEIVRVEVSANGVKSSIERSVH